MRAFFCVFLFIAVFTQVNGQSKVDSLRNELRSATTAAVRMQLVSQIGKTLFFGSQYDSLHKYAAQLRELAKGQQNAQMELLADALYAQGYVRKDYKIKRSDGVEITVVEASATTLRLSLQWSKGSLEAGRTGSVAGNHVFTFVRN